MPEILQPVQLVVERDGSGGIKLRLGTQMALMSPDQAFEFAMGWDVAGSGIRVRDGDP
jgi:hypothetical protein